MSERQYTRSPIKPHNALVYLATLLLSVAIVSSCDLRDLIGCWNAMLVAIRDSSGCKWTIVRE